METKCNLKIKGKQKRQATGNWTCHQLCPIKDANGEELYEDDLVTKGPEIGTGIRTNYRVRYGFCARWSFYGWYIQSEDGALTWSLCPTNTKTMINVYIYKLYTTTGYGTEATSK